ncbi:FAD:protein FMN transferase [Pseudorhodoferax sp.]|uniref:FAD:protein FMN transferase n=1 Tax=Pseudorhodoferax sp. TaxID=1993553 RepID=UPI002DD66999|nr:FAD:protein FMN transferase [Pseudorhodoferax sp.]
MHGPASCSRRAALGALLPLLPAAGRAAPAVERASAVLMGTRVDIVVDHADSHQRMTALDKAWSEMQRLAEMMSRYRSASQVSLLAQAAGGAPLAVAPELMQVLRQAQSVAQASGGRFDATIGACVAGRAGWRFEPGQSRLADAAGLQQSLALVNARDLELDVPRSRARLARPGMRLDLGGIAKLPILAAGLKTLQAHGITQALVNGGGDVVCAGTLQGRPWRVGLRDPLSPQRLLGAVALRGGVVAASGDYERGFVHQGRHYHHILDPRTGRPSEGLHGLALVADDVAAVNGWGPALMVAGVPLAQRWLARGPLRGVHAMLAGPAGVWLSEGMRQRLQLA